MPVITSDGQRLDDSRPLLTLEALCADHPTGGPLGVRLEPDDDPALLVDWLPRLERVALHFPHFTDGRPYSHARLLRTRLGFHGDLRAIGSVRRDQLDFLRRCGFTSFELDEAEATASEQPVRGYPELQDPPMPMESLTDAE